MCTCSQVNYKSYNIDTFFYRLNYRCRLTDRARHWRLSKCCVLPHHHQIKRLGRCFCVDCARADSITIRGKREFLDSDSTCQIFLEFLTNIHKKSKNQRVDSLLFTE